MQPYNLSCLLFLWILCNLGMISPWLPLAVLAQIIMGTVYVYTMKMSTDLNLFYSLGDTEVFLSLQVWCKNAEAMGGAPFGFLGPFFHAEVDPFFPFVVTTGLSGAGIACLEMETEAQRSERASCERATGAWRAGGRRRWFLKIEKNHLLEFVFFKRSKIHFAIFCPSNISKGLGGAVLKISIDFNWFQLISIDG